MNALDPKTILRPAELAERFEFLDRLRATGVTNMLGAAPYVQDRYGDSLAVSRAIVAEWARTFSDRNGSRHAPAESHPGAIEPDSPRGISGGDWGKRLRAAGPIARLKEETGMTTTPHDPPAALAVEPAPAAPPATKPTHGGARKVKRVAGDRTASPFTVLGHPLSRFLAWMGANGASIDETIYVLSALGHDVAEIKGHRDGPRSYIADRLYLGKTGRTRNLRPAEVAPEDVERLQAIVRKCRMEAP